MNRISIIVEACGMVLCILLPALVKVLGKIYREYDIFDELYSSSEKTVVLWKPFLISLITGLLLTASGFLLIFILGGWRNLLQGHPRKILIGILMLLSGIFFCGKSQKYIYPSASLQYYGYYIKKGIIYGFWIPFPLPLFVHMYRVPYSPYWGEEIFPGILLMIIYGPMCSVVGAVLGAVAAILYIRCKNFMLNRN